MTGGASLGEAASKPRRLAVGHEAGACRTVLTHFSQRYPGLPAGVDGLGDGDVVVASDLLRLTFPQLAWAPALVPALRALYGEEDAEEGFVEPTDG